MIGLKENMKMECKEEAPKKCSTLDKFLNMEQVSPPGSCSPGLSPITTKMVGDLRNYFSTSPPSTKTITAPSQNGKSESSKSLPSEKLSEKSKKTVNDVKSKPRTKKKDKPKITKIIKVDNEEELNGKENGMKDVKKVSEQQLKKSKKKNEISEESLEEPVAAKTDRDVEEVNNVQDDVANCSFVSFEDFLGDETMSENQAKNSVNQKKEKLQKNESASANDEKVGKKVAVVKRKQQKGNKVSKEDSSGDNKVLAKNDRKVDEKSESKILPDVKSCKTVVVEIHHSPTASPECKNQSPQRTNRKRRSNVVVESGNLTKIEVVQVEKSNTLPSLHLESKSNNTKTFSIFQKKTKQETPEVKAPMFSIFEKKSKKKEDDKLSEVKQEGYLKRKINKIEKEKMPQKKRKKVEFTEADTNTMSVDEFDAVTPAKKTIKKACEKRSENEGAAQNLRRSTRCAKVASSTSKKEFEVESAIRPDGTIRMKIRVKKIGTLQGRCDVKTATASKLLKKAKGQSTKVIKVNKKSSQSMVTKLKNSPTANKLRRLSGKRTSTANQEKQIVRKQAGKNTSEERNGKPQKVASIFTKERNKGSSTIKSSSPDCPEKKPLLVLDEETLKARRAFLNKDALIDGHRQTNTALNVNDIPEPPLPSIPHILQMDNNPMWNIAKANLNLRTIIDVKQICNIKWMRRLNNDADKNLKKDKYVIKDFSGHPEFSYETQRVLLNKLSLEYPKFPVRRIFKKYLAKYNGENDVCKKGRKNKGNEQTTSESNKQETGKQVKRKSVLSTEDEGRIKRRRMPDKEESDRKKEGKMDKISEEAKPVRRTRRKKNVITDEEEVKESKKDEVKVLPIIDVPATPTKPVGLLWTEKYQPSNIQELIGNQANTKKLHIWLTEWKKLAIREKRKMKKDIKMKNDKSASQTSKDWWNQDEDSDFDFIDDYDSDDDSDDDYGNDLCNTKILVGPSGAGKTAAVYACATELGFKVFEVNASNRRNGKQILSELGEATQSHHVARQSVSGPLASFLSVQGSPKKLANPVTTPKGIQSFFKPAAATQTKKKETKKQPKKSVAEVSKEPLVKQDEKLLPAKITSTSLIFFKDVDIVFGEDKGFIAAINSFMETTKRPIIMTTSDPTICDDFSSHSETYQYRNPSVDQVAVNMQLICLAENVLANRADLIRLAYLLDCDVRRCITTLQFWVESGAGNSATFDQALLDESRNNLTAIEDTSTNATMKNNGVSNQGNDAIMKNKDATVSNMTSDLAIQVQPHYGCFESSVGLLNMQSSLKEMFNFLKYPNQGASDFCKQCELVAGFNDLGISVLPNNIHTLLPRIHHKRKKRTSQKINNDHKTDDKDNKTDDKDHKIDDNDHKNDAIHKRLSNQVMDTFSVLAEDMSFMDICGKFTESQRKSTFDLLGQRSKFTTGLSDLPVVKDEHNRSCMLDVIAAIQVASYRCCRKSLEDVENEMMACTSVAACDIGCDSVEDDGQVPFQIHYETELQRRSIIAREVMYSSVASKLPLQANQRSLGISYFPSLRNICRNEKFRKETQQKRRYLHYLDSVSLVLKENTHVILATSLQPSQ